MGSEGRGEQLLKTDQDNGLILRDDTTASEADVADACQRFAAALRDFGYPDCPGDIMVSNPAWRRRASDFAGVVRGWLLRPDPQGLMALAIFIDAHAVAGDAALLSQVRAEVDRVIAADDALLGRFAAAIDSFPEETGGWWNRLLPVAEHDRQTLDLKKSGIFPIVHGVRSLALRDHLQATGTQARIEALVAAGRLPARFATDLADSLHLLMTMKLKAGIAELDSGGTVSGAVRSDTLSSLERDLLKDALAVVRRFKAIVRNQFHLEGG
jgi:CBS domain-containing protein